MTTFSGFLTNEFEHQEKFSESQQFFLQNMKILICDIWIWIMKLLIIDSWKIVHSEQIYENQVC